MPSSRAIHRLATRPADLMRFQMTGQLPQGVRPQGPLVDLLRAIEPRFLNRIAGVTIDQRLGYTGNHPFHYAAQALRWIAPAEEVFDGFPAESYRIKRFTQKLYLEDLAACCCTFPEQLLRTHARLRRPEHLKQRLGDVEDDDDLDEPLLGASPGGAG